MTLVEKASSIAEEAHMGQTRKLGGGPYVEHPRAVAKLLEEAGCDEETVAAARVHDVLEDTSYGEERLRRELGTKVVDIVQEVSEDKTRAWRERKEEYIEKIRHASYEAQLVSLADKIHNLRSILESYASLGVQVWDAFTRGKDDTMWYYAALHIRRRADVGASLEIRRA